MNTVKLAGIPQFLASYNFCYSADFDIRLKFKNKTFSLYCPQPLKKPIMEGADIKRGLKIWAPSKKALRGDFGQYSIGVSVLLENGYVPEEKGRGMGTRFW